MKTFQIVLIVIFILLAVVGVLMFAGYIPTPGGGSTRTEPVTLLVWGTLPSNKISNQLDSLEVGEKVSLRYVQKSREDIEVDLLRATRDGTPPDLLLFPHELLLTLEDSLYKIEDSSSFDTRDFKNLFIEGSEIFIRENKISALPVLVDPIVLYWNRDIFNNKRITEVPQTWTEIINFSNEVTERDQTGKILLSAIALGEADNVVHFKDILSLLLLQVGDGIVERSKLDASPQVVFGDALPGQSSGLLPAESALLFYSGFSDPIKRHYSWNASLPTSFNAFAFGDLALYLAPASEYELIRSRNPLLNYDVASVPQREEGIDANYGSMYSVGIIKDSQHFNEAFAAAFHLSYATPENQTLLSDVFFLPPAKRSLLSGGSTNSAMSIFYDEAIISRAWLDPDPVATQNIFRKMVRDVSVNVSSVEQAIATAKTSLRGLVNRN